MTHDLIFNLAKHFDLNLIEVVINDLSEGIFYARLVIEAEGEIHEIDTCNEKNEKCYCGKNINILNIPVDSQLHILFGMQMNIGQRY